MERRHILVFMHAPICVVHAGNMDIYTSIVIVIPPLGYVLLILFIILLYVYVISAWDLERRVIETWPFHSLFFPC